MNTVVISGTPVVMATLIWLFSLWTLFSGLNVLIKMSTRKKEPKGIEGGFVIINTVILLVTDSILAHFFLPEMATNTDLYFKFTIVGIAGLMISLFSFLALGKEFGKPRPGPDAKKKFERYHLWLTMSSIMVPSTSLFTLTVAVLMRLGFVIQ